MNGFGFGFSAALGTLLNLSDDVIPVVSLSWVDDYLKIDITDNSDGAAETQIYASTDGSAFELITTLDAGIITYNYSSYQNAVVEIKAKAKIGSATSDFSSAESITTPLVFKTDQTTRANVVINTLVIGAGKTVNIDWGDGVIDAKTGTSTNITKTYSASAVNIFYIKLTGDINSITSFQHYGNRKSYGSLEKWNLPTAIITFRVSACTFTGDLSGWGLPVNLATFLIHDNQRLYFFVIDKSGCILFDLNQSLIYIVPVLLVCN